MKNTTGSLTMDGLGGQGWSRGSKQWDHNQSGLTPKMTGERTNLRGNMGGLDELNGSQPVIGGEVKPMNWKRAGVMDMHKDTEVRGSRGPQKGNQR